jgi:putative ABC transport system ATP-binding protein
MEINLAAELFLLEQVNYLHIINRIDLKLFSGEITAIVGKSGSGKTSLLRLLNKLNSPTAGTIKYDGQDLAALDSISHRRQVSMLMQNPVMFPGTVRDNLLAGLRFQGKPAANDGQMQEILDELQMNVTLDQDAQLLSGGEKQRLAIGRLILLDPPVWLLDEPSSALDRTTEDQLVNLLVDHIRKQNKSLIMITHAPEIAEKYADRVIEIEAGQVFADRQVATDHRLATDRQLTTDHCLEVQP